MATTSQQRVLEILRKEVDCAGELLDVLHREQEALGQRDADTVEGVVTEKQAVIGRLEELQGERLGLMDEGGYTRDSEGMAALVVAAPEALSADLDNAWQDFEERLQRCQEQNQVNGQVLESSIRQTRQALSILVGGGATESGLYNRDGAKTGPTGTRSYAKV